MATSNEDVDYHIIRLLQKNGRMPNTEIAKRLGVSETTVRNRLQNLIKEEQIQVVAVVNPLKRKIGIVGNLRITAEKKKLNPVAEALSALDELWYIAQNVGEADFDAEFCVNSQGDFGLLMDRVHQIDGIVSAKASIIVRYIKYSGSPGV